MAESDTPILPSGDLSVVSTANQTVDTLIRFIETSGLTRILNSIWSTTLMLL